MKSNLKMIGAGLTLALVFGVCASLAPTQVQAQTIDEQKQALVGEWSGVWPGFYDDVSTLVVHEIDAEKKRARCTYTSPKGTFQVLAEFTPGPNPEIKFKLDYAELRFVLHGSTLQANVEGEIRGTQMSNQTDMKRKPGP